MKDPYILFEEARCQQGSNPFTRNTVVSAEEVWGEIITDLPGINQHIEQRVTQAINEVRQKHLNKIGITVKGDKGRGKSHAIRRVWKNIEREGGALFAYISPCPNAKYINGHVRFHLVESLTHQDAHGVTQWQRFAATLISRLKGTEYEESYQDYIEKCDRPNDLKKCIQKTNSSDGLGDFFGALTEAISEQHPGLDYYFTKAVLLSLMGSALPAQTALSWIKGADTPDIKRFGLPDYSPEQQITRNIWVIQQICKLSQVASLPVIIWFDQAEVSADDNESGDSSVQVVAKCIDQIYFDCTNVVLLCCVLQSRWVEIMQMPGGTPDRISQIVLEAKPPTAEQMIDLAQARLNWFYKEKNLNPGDYPPLYPIDEARIKELAKAGSSVRQLLEKCAELFEKPSAIPIDPVEKRKKQVLATYNEVLSKISLPPKEDEKIGAIIVCAMKMLPGNGMGNVIIHEVNNVGFSSAHDLHLIVSGYDSAQQKPVSIGIRVSETTNATTFKAIMQRLINYDKYNITRGCLVRSTPVPKSFKVGQQLIDQLVNQQGGEVVVLEKEHVKPLAALERIYEQATDYGFEREEFVALVQELGLIADNPLIDEILSAPTPP